MALKRAEPEGGPLVITARQFGSSLRRHRERQNITLKVVEARTKISVSLLAGLEKGDCSRWPAGIYSRSWVRAYAQVIGLDPEATVTQFAECFAETAFPDAPSRAESGGAEQVTLRLGLEPEPGWRVRAALARTPFACIDLVLILSLALATWATGAVTLVSAAAVAAVLIHTIGVVSGCGSTSGAIQHLVRVSRESAEARERRRARESTLAEVA
jgi:transcriptional regulator with XRE-family HTH domain